MLTLASRMDGMNESGREERGIRASEMIGSGRERYWGGWVCSNMSGR